MRKGLMIAAAIACMLAPASAMATDWYRVVQTDKLTDYVDADSIHQEGQWTVARINTVYLEPQDENVKTLVVDLQVDCKARQLRLAHFTVITADGTTLADADWPENGKLTEIVPNTPFDVLANFICGKDRKGVRVEDPMTDDPSA
jgi:hypothetical protein